LLYKDNKNNSILLVCSTAAGVEQWLLVLVTMCGCHCLAKHATTGALLANSSDAKNNWHKDGCQHDSHTPQQRFNMVFWTQVFHTELRFSAESRRHFLLRYSNTEN